jgi:hypothetical protein
MDSYRSLAKPVMKSGETVLFWPDEWEINNSTTPLHQRFPRLFSFVKDDKISVRDMILLRDRAEELHLPLSGQAFDEFLVLQTWLQDFNLQNPGADEWKCPWGVYKASKYYLSLFDHIQVAPQFSWIWKSKCIMRVKMFAWLLLSDRLNTKDMIQRRHWNVTSDYTCFLCSRSCHEDRDHLFFNCLFSSRIWNYLQIEWGYSGQITLMAENARRRFRWPFFTEVVALACRNIWKVRNTRIFNNVRPRFAAWRGSFIHDISLHAHHFRDDKKEILLHWIKSLH